MRWESYPFKARNSRTKKVRQRVRVEGVDAVLSQKTKEKRLRQREGGGDAVEKLSV